METLGQLVKPLETHRKLSIEKINEIREHLNVSNEIIEIYVTSKNSLKIQAAVSAVVCWVTELLGHNKFKYQSEGFEVSSDIDEQPHGLENTLYGADNRLNNMKIELSMRNDFNTLCILVSLENGLNCEQVSNVKNPEIFLVDGKVWVDRCIVVGELWFKNKAIPFDAISEGVTTPKDAVALSEQSNWTKTAGFFIAEKYGFNAKDWHAGMCGKNRQTIMEETIKTSLGLPCSILFPNNNTDFKSDVYHQYTTESIDFFCPNEISEMIVNEKQSQNIDSHMWRDYYQTIGHPIKPGADGKNPSNSVGIILTEDIIVGYFDKINNQDILHIILLWAKPEEGVSSLGWALPGKRDRAYDKKSGDISVEDANYSLIEKEIGCDRSNIAYHFIIGYFDDRKREQRMKSSGFVSFILLDKKPELISGQRIGIPVNGLIKLIKHEITIPRYSQDNVSFGLIRNHDSLLLNIMETTKFCHIMNKIKIAQAKWRELVEIDTRATRPDLPEFDTGYDCSICMELIVDSKIICDNGHSICGACSKTLYSTKNCFCPICRSILLPEAIPNRILEHIVQNQYPKIYAERYSQLVGSEPISWKNDSIFNGSHIQYL